MLLIFVDRTMKKEGRGVPAVVKAWYLSEELSFGCEDSRSDDMGDYVQVRSGQVRFAVIEKADL